jgi:uncharacterized protein
MKHIDTKPMEISPHIQIIDLALLYKDNLIIGDIQLGYEEALEAKGLLVPRFQLQDIIERLDTILKKTKVNKVIINGDIKHEFGTITNQEWRDSLKLFDHILNKVDEIILIKGNHDIILDPIAQKRNIKVVDQLDIDDISIIHGHTIPLNLNNTIIIGHEHPAISFKERREEKFKCFLQGIWQGKTLIVQPSFHSLTKGSDVTNERFLSTFLKDGVNNFKVYIVEDDVKYFGKVKDILKL